MRTALPIVLAGMLAVACGGSSKQPVASSPASSTQAPSATTTTAATTAATTSTAATTTTASPSVALCRAAGLQLSFVGGQGATGHGELGFALRNVSGAPCHTFGYPGIQFLDTSGKPLPTVSTRTTHDFFGTAPLTSLDVAPGATFSFRIGVTHGAASSAGCTTAAGLAVIPPNDTASLHITIPNGAYECATATVSPVRPGESAYVGG